MKNMTELCIVKNVKNAKEVGEVRLCRYRRVFLSFMTFLTLSTFSTAFGEPEPAAAVIGPVTLEVSGTQLIIKVANSRPDVKFDSMRRINPLRLIIEFPNTKIKGGPSIQKVGQAGVKRIITEQTKPTLTSVILELTQWPASYNLEKTAQAIVLQIKSDQPLKPLETPLVVKVAEPKKTEIVAAKPSPEKPLEMVIEKPVEKPIVKIEKPIVKVEKPIAKIELPKSEPKPEPQPEPEPEIKIVKMDPPRSAPPQKSSLDKNEEEVELPEPSVKDASTQTPLKKLDLDQKVDLHLQNADMLATLINIADELGYNLVPSKSVAGTVTIRLTQVPLKRALALMLNQAGLSYVVTDNVMRVATAGELQAEEDQDRHQTRVFSINYATAAETMTLLKTVLSANGKVEIDSRTNRLIITDTPLKLDKAGAMIKQLDTPTPQVEIEAAVIAFSRGGSKEFGIQWQATQGSITGRTPSGSGNPIDVDVLSGAPVSGAAFGNLAIGAITNGVTVGALLAMLEKSDEAEVLAKPHITTLNNKAATINITTDFPYTSAFNAQTGIATFATVSTGILLSVTPQINDDGYVTLKVNPSVSSIVSAGPPPVVDKREATTEVLVKSGSTLVIGGLLREDEVVTTNKIPLLAELPIVGGIFRSTSSSKAKNELTILITPKIIRQTDK